MERIQITWGKSGGYLPPPVMIDFYLVGPRGKLLYFVSLRPNFVPSEVSEQRFLDILIKRDKRLPTLPMPPFVVDLTVNPKSRLNRKPYRTIFSLDPKWNDYFRINGLHPASIITLWSWPEVIYNRRRRSWGNINSPPIYEKERLISSPDYKRPSSNEIGLNDLPFEVYEALAPYLDAITFDNIGKLSLNVEDLLWQALGTNKTKLSVFWRTTAFNAINRECMIKIFCSFDNVIERTLRIRRRFLLVKDDYLLTHNFEDACRTFLNFWDIVSQGKLVVINMTEFEQASKEYMKRITKDPVLLEGPHTADSNLRRFVTMIGSSGSFLYNFLFSNDEKSSLKAVIAITEGLNNSLALRHMCMCKWDARFIKIMYVPLISDCSKCPIDRLPQYHRILVCVCRYCIHLQPLQEGEGLIIPIPKYNWPTRQSDPLIAIEDDCIGGWENPFSFRVHRISVSKIDSGFQIQAQLIQQNHVEDSKDQWERIELYREFYIPVLKRVIRKFDNMKEDRKTNLRKFYTKAQLEDYYELRLISSQFGQEHIGGPSQMYKLTDLVREIEKEPKVVKPLHPIVRKPPQYYMQNALRVKESLCIVTSGCQGYGLYIFWNDKSVGVSWNGVRWLFEFWETALKDVKDSIGGEITNISHIAVCSPDGIVVGINGNIVIFKVTKTKEGDYVKRKKVGSKKYEFDYREPTLILIPVRIISLDLTKAGLSISQLTCDFDQGVPYILLMTRKINTMDAYEYFLTRFTFQDESQAKNERVDTDTSHFYDKCLDKEKMKEFIKDPKVFAQISYLLDPEERKEKEEQERKEKEEQENMEKEEQERKEKEEQENMEKEEQENMEKEEQEKPKK